METLDHPSWHWGLSLIALTVAIHATAVVMMAFVMVRIRARLEARALILWKLIAILIFLIVVIGLLLAILHGIECGIWAAAYLWLGALDSPIDALLFSVDSMSTRGASRLTLQPHCRRDATGWCERGLHFRGDAGILVNARTHFLPQGLTREGSQRTMSALVISETTSNDARRFAFRQTEKYTSSSASSLRPIYAFWGR